MSWKLLERTATATQDAPRCSEVGAGALACEAASSDFHCCTSIADCTAAARFTLYASQSAELGDRVRVLDERGAPGSVLSLGALVMGTEAEVGDVATGGELILGGATALLGDVHVTGNVTNLSRASTPNFRRVPLDAPDLAAFARAFAARGGAEVTVSEEAEQRLTPGAYGAGSIHGHVTLSSGRYWFTTLEIFDTARVSIDAQHGPVLIQVASSVSLRGQLDALPGELLIELTGPGRIAIGTNLAATVYAVNGRIDIETPGTTQRGSFMAQQLSVASDVTLIHTDPLALR